MTKIINIILVALILITGSCGNKKVISIERVTRDKHFNQLFHITSEGTTGADGTISVALPDGSSVFMMGDSFLGKVKNNKRDSSTKMINNTFIVLNPEQTATKTWYKGTYGNPDSFVVPENDPGKFYWPGHGFVRDSVFHFFMSRFWTPGTGIWGFEFLNTDYLRYSWPAFEKISVEPFEYTLRNNVHWGHAVLDEHNYIYIYGSKPGEGNIYNAHVCRCAVTSKNMLDLTNVEFFDGTSWAKEPMITHAMKGLSNNISEQFSVFKYQGTYVLLSQQRGIGAGEIYTYTSKNPYGPWENKQMIYCTTEQDKNADIITYNAMAHPQYIENNELLISYNVNSLNASLIHENVDYYRPVFLRVPLEIILNE
ncbi:MAG: hypothetical protein ACK5M7_06515 [Draconibacterium sp.]